MNEFSMLRERARDRRDLAIKTARADYAQSITKIAELEEAMMDRGKPKIKRISDCVCHVMPKDRPFTVQDICELLEALDPRRVWHVPAVTNCITHIRLNGLIYRVRKPKKGVQALYAVKGLEAASKLGDTSLAEVMRGLLTRPMTATELTVAVTEAGYETWMTPKSLRATVLRTLGRGKFTRTGDRG